MKNSKHILTIIFWLILPQLFGIIGSVFTAFLVKTWYPMLIKPSLNPPDWVFGPVWTILFLFMGIAAYYVWSTSAKATGGQVSGRKNKNVKVALAIFVGQLVLNTLWSILFFGLHRQDLALVEIVILWLAILATIISFYRISKTAAWLLVPYILWVSFAAYLNYSIWSLNKPASALPRTPGEPVFCTQEAMLCPDGSYVGRTGPNCDFAPCPEVQRQEQGIQLPKGYTLDSYKIEKVLEMTCSKNSDCELPFEYAVRSNCPYIAPCLKNKCTVVCPSCIEAN